MPGVRDSRRLWVLFEPIHALTYFAPEAHHAYEEVGLRGFWRGYFAGRAAPLGPVGPGVATACFYGFHPAFVARALPDIWSIAAPPAALAARLSGVDGAIRRLYPDEIDRPAFRESTNLLREALETCAGAGRPLFSANRGLEWPEAPHLALWHAATLAREHRGDGHVATLTALGIGPCEAHVLRLAADGTPRESLQPHRGWSNDHWTAALDVLARRGWVDADERLTEEGRAVRQLVESTTDRLADELFAHIDDARYEQLVAHLHAIARRLVETGTIPYPNPIGVPPPS
jgi:DNA-binding MarR family transcriptional regulator